MSDKVLDASWRGWLDENLARGCNEEELLGRLLQNGFAIASIRDAMATRYPRHSPLALAAEKREADPVDLATVTTPRITRPESGAARFPSDKLQLYTLENFLAPAECDAIVAVIDRSLRPSSVTIPTADRAYRTSRTSDLSLVQSDVVAALDERIARTLGIHPSYSEGIQAQRYDVGQQFKQHTDYFEPGTPEYLQYAGARGNRTWTFMVYLNDVEAGGATRFFALDHELRPVKGCAVVWNSLRADGNVNPDTLHAGMPVTAGHKVIVTKWFRERGEGEMRYEASEARIDERVAARVASLQTRERPAG
jgi:prolyl 4-hydroxylase